MTVLTKPLSEKKGDKLVVPLVENDQLANTPQDDVEAQHRSVFILRTRAHRVSNVTTLCLLLTALAVVGLGILGGTYLYDQYLRVQRNSPGKFSGWAQIPYSQEDFDREFDNDDNSDSEFLNNVVKEHYFQEEFEIDDDVEKIDVPDFKDGRNGRFIHDFNTNVTGIIDVTGNRCFVMPLNRSNVLPPKSLFDLIHKMWDGYYKVDTEIVRETMRVVTPPVKDLSTIGNYIARECQGRPVYKLEKFVGGVVKRSADIHTDGKFAQFAGRGITELDIVNFEDLELYEKNANSP